MTKLFLDSNIWLRYFLKDNDEFEKVEKLLTVIEEGRFLPYISPIVLLEVIYVLQITYKLPKEDIEKYVSAIIEVRNLVIINKFDTKKALSYFYETHIKFGDCLIASQIAPKMILVTFDKELSKIKAVKTLTPAQLLVK